MTTAILHSWADIENERLNPLATRQYVHGTQAMLCRFALGKGCLIPYHSHPNEQISFVVEGCIRFVLGDGKDDIRLVHTGEILVIPANIPHSAEALQDTIALDIFAPPRQDWIDKQDAYLR